MQEITLDGVWKMKYRPVAGITAFRPKFQNGLPTNRCEFIVHRLRGDIFKLPKRDAPRNIERSAINGHIVQALK